MRIPRRIERGGRNVSVSFMFRVIIKCSSDSKNSPASWRHCCLWLTSLSNIRITWICMYCPRNILFKTATHIVHTSCLYLILRYGEWKFWFKPTSYAISSWRLKGEKVSELISEIIIVVIDFYSLLSRLSRQIL